MDLFGRKASGSGIPATGGSVFGSTTIAWEDQYKRENVMWKVPRLIRLNDNIVVREDEIAVFFRDGKVLTYFDQPNRYALTDFNAPVTGKLLKFFSGVVQQAEVFYVQKRFFDGKFGSTQPYEFTDPVFGVVSLRVYGDYRYRVANPENFINQFVGTFNAETTEDVDGRLKEQMVLLTYNAIGKMKDKGMKVTDLATSLTNIEQVILSISPDHFQQYGIEINKVPGLTISLPEEVQKAVDTRSQMSVLGVNYIQYQAGQAMVDAANNPSGVAGVGAGLGVGLGAGAGVGYAMAGPMMQGVQQQQQMKSCYKCGSMVPVSSTFCPSCGANLTQPATVTCSKCGEKMPQGTKFCPNCGTAVVQQQAAQQQIKCASCGFVLQSPAKFCPNCGKPM